MKSEVAFLKVGLTFFCYFSHGRARLTGAPEPEMAVKNIANSIMDLSLEC